MSRLYEITYNKKYWTIKGNRSNGYRFVRKAQFCNYFLYGDIIGIEQITDDSFLVYSKISYKEWALTRWHLYDGNKVEEYSHRFKDFDFLNENIIIFNKNSVSSCKLYNIKQNLEISYPDFIAPGLKHDIDFCKERRIKFLYANSFSEYPKYLKIDYALHSNYGNEFIQIMVDAKTLEVLSPIYSTLRSQYLEITDSSSLSKFFEEDNKYLHIIDKFLHSLYNTDTKRTDSELWSKITNK